MAYLILESGGPGELLRDGGYYDFDPENKVDLESIKAMISERYGNATGGAAVTLLSASSNELKPGRRGPIGGFLDMLKHCRKNPLGRIPPTPRLPMSNHPKRRRYLGRTTDLSAA